MWWLVVIGLIVLCWMLLVAYGAMSVRGQRRALARLRGTGVAFLCLPERGQWGTGMWIVSADPSGAVLSRGSGGRLRPAWRLAAGGATVTPAAIPVNTARTVPGIRIAGPGGPPIEVALYPDPTMGRSKPLSGGPLEAAAHRLAEALGASAGRTR